MYPKETLSPLPIDRELKPLSLLPPDLRKVIQRRILVRYFEEPNLFEEDGYLPYFLKHGTAFSALIPGVGWEELYRGMIESGEYPLVLFSEAMSSPTYKFTGVLPYAFAIMEDTGLAQYMWVQPALWKAAPTYIFWRGVLAFQQQKRDMASDLPPSVANLTVDQTLIGGVAAWLGKVSRRVPYQPIDEWIRTVLGKFYFIMGVRHIATNGGAITLEERHRRVIKMLLGEDALSLLDLATWRQSRHLGDLELFNETFGFRFRHTWGEVLKELVTGGFMPQIVETLAGFERPGDPNLGPWARLIEFESRIGMGFLDFLSTLPDEILQSPQGPFNPKASNSELAFIKCARSGNLNCKFLLLAYLLNQITVTFVPNTLPRVGFETGRPTYTLRPAFVLPLAGKNEVDVFVPMQLGDVIEVLFGVTFNEFRSPILTSLIRSAYDPTYPYVGSVRTKGGVWQCSGNYERRRGPSSRGIFVPPSKPRF